MQRRTGYYILSVLRRTTLIAGGLSACLFLGLVGNSSTSFAKPPVKKSSQNSKIQSIGLDSLPDLLHRVMPGQRIGWMLSFGYDDDDKYQSRSPEVAFADLQAYIKQGLPGSYDDKRVYREESLKLKRNQRDLETTLLSLSYLKSQRTGFTSRSYNPPVSYGDKAGKSVLLVSQLALPIWLNILNYNQSERSKIVVMNYAVPALAKIADGTKKMADCPYVGVSISYGTKRFLPEGEYVDKKEGEVISVIAKRSEVNNYNNAKITQEELISRSDIYMIDRDSPNSGPIRKVSVK